MEQQPQFSQRLPHGGGITGPVQYQDPAIMSLSKMPPPQPQFPPQYPQQFPAQSRSDFIIVILLSSSCDQPRHSQQMLILTQTYQRKKCP